MSRNNIIVDEQYLLIKLTITKIGYSPRKLSLQRTRIKNCMELLFNSYRTFILYIHTSKIDYQKWIPLCNRSYFDKLITLNHPIDPWIDSFNFIRNIYRSSTCSNLPPINGFRAHLATQ